MTTAAVGMAPVYTTGSWVPFPGREEAFLDAWESFASWAAGLPGAGEGILVRDLRDPDRFVSFMAWESMDAVRAWKTHPEFKERMSRVQEHVDKFSPTETEIVRRVTAG
jgi:heme-degrading monooxygenase HmoA